MQSEVGKFQGPLYLQVSDRLIDQLRSRKWSAGEIMPNEFDLARNFGVSVGTMRKAMKRLEDDGWISRQRGRGTTVRDYRPAKNVLGAHFRIGSRDIWDLEHKYEFAGLETANEVECAELKQPARAQVIHVTGRLTLGGALVAIDKISLPASLFPNWSKLDLATGTRPLLDVLDESFNVSAHHAQESLRIISASQQQAADLNIATGAPLIAAHRISYTADNTPMELVDRIIGAGDLEYIVAAAK